MLSRCYSSKVKRALTTILIASLALAISPAISSGAVKAGDACKKAGQVSNAAGKKYTCIKSGKKLVWNKGVAIPKPTPSPTASVTPTSIATPTPTPTVSSTPTPKFLDPNDTYSTDDGYIDDINGPCEFDPRTPKEWVGVVFDSQSNPTCSGILRLGKYSLGLKLPLVPFEQASKFSNTEMCKLTTPSNSRSGLGWTTTQSGRNEWRELRKYPSPKTVIQLIPISAQDTAAPKNSPSYDYGKYLNYIKEWIEYSSDNGSQVEVRIPSKYIEMQSMLSSYKIVHTNNHDDPEHVRFNRDVVTASDALIDFSGVNIVIVVPTAGSKSTVLQQGALGPMRTNEGTIGVTSTQYADSMVDPKEVKFSNLAHPFWWVHELFHVGFGLDDHYGDSQRNVNSDYGMGNWSLMTPWGGDLTSYEKWLLGFISDNQVQCVSSIASSRHWIIPTTVKSNQSKTVMIPITTTKMIIVESIRPAGLYYKIPQRVQGVLVYEVDLMQDGHGMGMKLSLPIGRSMNSNPFFMASATLKVGESTISNGVKISIIESGTWGDVIKVEKA